MIQVGLLDSDSDGTKKLYQVIKSTIECQIKEKEYMLGKKSNRGDNTYKTTPESFVYHDDENNNNNALDDLDKSFFSKTTPSGSEL